MEGGENEFDFKVEEFKEGEINRYDDEDDSNNYRK